MIITLKIIIIFILSALVVIFWDFFFPKKEIKVDNKIDFSAIGIPILEKAKKSYYDIYGKKPKMDEDFYHFCIGFQDGYYKANSDRNNFYYGKK